MFKQSHRVRFVINSLSEEREMVRLTKKKDGWFKVNKYHFLVPNGPLEDVYQKEDYMKRTLVLERIWRKEEQKFFSILDDFFGRRIKRVIVHITKYGVGGGYFLPNHVYLNCALPFDSMKTIKHEILHLVVESYIQKYKVSHSKKEKLVDCLMGLFG